MMVHHDVPLPQYSIALEKRKGGMKEGKMERLRSDPSLVGKGRGGVGPHPDRFKSSSVQLQSTCRLSRRRLFFHCVVVIIATAFHHVSNVPHEGEAGAYG
jgi:hypothetical protein